MKNQKNKKNHLNINTNQNKNFEELDLDLLSEINAGNGNHAPNSNDIVIVNGIEFLEGDLTYNGWYNYYLLDWGLNFIYLFGI